jgi:hypothetical protein
LFSPLQVAVVLAADDSDLTATISALVFAATIALSVRDGYTHEALLTLAFGSLFALVCVCRSCS